MSKQFAAILGAFVLFFSLHNIFSAEASTPDEKLTDIQRIQKSGVLRVAVCDMQNPPSFYRRPNGSFDGIDIRMVKDIAEQMGVKVEFVVTDRGFDGIPDVVAEGRADIGVGTLSVTSKRAKKVLFSHPYVSNLHNALIINGPIASKLGIEGNLEKIKKAGLTIGIKKHSSRKDTIERDYQGSKVMEFENVNDMKSAVMEGTADAIMVDSFYAEYIMKQPGCILILQSLIIPGSEDCYAIAVNPELVMLRDYLSIIIKERGMMMRGSSYMRSLLAGIEGGDTVMDMIGKDGDSQIVTSASVSPWCLVTIFVLLIFLLFFIYFMSPNGWALRIAYLKNRKNQLANN